MNPVYLDFQATTPTDEQVVKKMLPFFTKDFGNPHSVSHVFGDQANKSIENARALVAESLGAKPSEIIFTSGATESNNLALKGGMNYRVKYDKRTELVIVCTEHKCVIEAAKKLSLTGVKVTNINVDSLGIVDLEQLNNILNDKVAIVSVMIANNEIGVIQPLKQISKICKKHDVWMHTDAAQAIGNIKIDVNELGIDLMSISGHKVYGPKGVGALYFRRNPRVRLIPEIDGGGQEKLIRSGTVPTPLVVGLGEAIKLSYQNFDHNKDHIMNLRNKLYEDLYNSISDISINGPSFRDSDLRLHNNINISIPGVDGTELVSELGSKVAFSTGSACSTGDIEPSYVLKSIGLSDDLAMSSVRISVGRITSLEEIEYAVEMIIKKVKLLRK